MRRLHRFLTQRAQRIHREHIDCILCLSFRRNLKESYDFDKINSFSRIPQISQIFNTESTEFFHREHKDCILCLSFRRNIKESYDFDKIKNLSLIAQIAQIFFDKIKYSVCYSKGI